MNKCQKLTRHLMPAAWTRCSAWLLLPCMLLQHEFQPSRNDTGSSSSLTCAAPCLQRPAPTHPAARPNSPRPRAFFKLDGSALGARPRGHSRCGKRRGTSKHGRLCERVYSHSRWAAIFAARSLRGFFSMDLRPFVGGGGPSIRIDEFGRREIWALIAPIVQEGVL